MPASGTLTKNTADQPKPSVSTPPSSEPSVSPLAPAPPQTASARLRRGPSSNSRLTSDSVAGNRMAPPTPCTARATMITPGLQASPPTSEEAA